MRWTRGSGSNVSAVIDSNVLVGGPSRREYGFEAALQELASHRVSAALVSPRGGAVYRHEVGNNEALSWAGVANGVDVHPVATLNPVQYVDWQAELERALAGGAVAIRMFPDVQRWSVTSEAFRAIVSAIRGRCPLLVPVSAFGDASAIGVATQHLEAPVVLLGAHYTQLADCLAAMRRWPHLHLETCRLAQFRGVETVVREVGAARLLFGSGAATRPIQAALNAILTAQITESERNAILGGNAVRLFGLTVPEDHVMPLATAVRGLIDVHGHVGSLGFPTPWAEPCEYPAAVARHGIKQTMASSLRAIVDDPEVGNAEALRARSEAMLVYVVLNPNDLDGACAAMDAAYRLDRVVGAKVHCSWSGQPTASRACMTLLQEVARRGRPLKIHVDGLGWEQSIAEIAGLYPDWRVIVAHAGPGMASPACVSLLQSTSNVYVELSTSYADLPVVRDVVDAAGPARLLFGSDAPLLDPAYVQGIYADAGADLAPTAAVAETVFGL
jgi:predicted TIM-barrel fold metal-dependent hydrolase